MSERTQYWEEYDGPPLGFWLNGIADSEVVEVRPGDRILFEVDHMGGEYLIDVERRGTIQ